MIISKINILKYILTNIYALIFNYTLIFNPKRMYLISYLSYIHKINQ